MTLKDLIEKDLETDMAGLKATERNEVQKAELAVEITFNKDEEPKEFVIDVEYELLDDNAIDIIDYTNIPGVDKKILASLMKTIDMKRHLVDGAWITLYDNDFGKL